MASEPLYQFVYLSKISVRGILAQQLLANIREESKRFNPQHQITGVLCYANFHFFQCVEGLKEDLLMLKGKLEKDPRHHSIKTLDFSPIAERRFRFWVMQALVLEHWYMNDERYDEMLPFYKLIKTQAGWRTALDHLAKMDAATDNSNVDMIALIQSDFVYRVQKVAAKHQVFLFVQTILGLLVLISLVFLLKEFL